MSGEKKNYREALKVLRERMGGPNKEVSQQVKSNNNLAKQVTEAIKGGLHTVPEIAEKIGYPTDKVLWMVNALRKYNGLELIDKRGEYPKYDFVQGENKNE
ncbi:MAG: hypothetical protein ACTSSG_00020 [Candidatus Heimdallarchaeaceae archaeon]